MVNQLFSFRLFRIITVVTLMSFVTEESYGSLLMTLKIYLFFIINGTFTVVLNYFSIP